MCFSLRFAEDFPEKVPVLFRSQQLSAFRVRSFHIGRNSFFIADSLTAPESREHCLADIVECAVDMFFSDRKPALTERRKIFIKI